MTLYREVEEDDEGNEVFVYSAMDVLARGNQFYMPPLEDEFVSEETFEEEREIREDITALD